MTVINQKSLEKAREEFPGATAPKKLRVKKTRAIRRALTKEQVCIRVTVYIMEQIKKPTFLFTVSSRIPRERDKLVFTGNLQ